MENPNFFWYVISQKEFIVAAFDNWDEANDYAIPRGFLVKHRSQLSEFFVS